MAEDFEIRILPAEDIRCRIEELNALLVDCVEGGAGVSLMLPFGRADAEKFWHETASECEAGNRIVLGAIMGSQIVGSVQLVPVRKQNQPHRAEISKLLVHRKARRKGIARALMQRLKRSLLCFDTTTGDAAERLYLSLDYVRAGVIPGYAYRPDGLLVDTSVFYKTLKSVGAG